MPRIRSIGGVMRVGRESETTAVRCGSEENLGELGVGVQKGDAEDRAS